MPPTVSGKGALTVNLVQELQTKSPKLVSPAREKPAVVCVQTRSADRPRMRILDWLTRLLHVFAVRYADRTVEPAGTKKMPRQRVITKEDESEREAAAMEVLGRFCVFLVQGILNYEGIAESLMDVKLV